MGWTFQWSPESTNTHHLNDDINNATDDTDISMNYVSVEEIEEGLRALANNKSAGLDFILAELLKCGGVAMVDKLTEIASIVWHTVKVPDKWKCGSIVKLSKKDICLIAIIGDVCHSFELYWKNYRKIYMPK